VEIATLLARLVGAVLRLALLTIALWLAFHNGEWAHATFYLVLAYAGDEVKCKQ
jgi:hypothetical protein